MLLCHLLNNIIALMDTWVHQRDPLTFRLKQYDRCILYGRVALNANGSPGLTATDVPGSLSPELGSHSCI